MNEMYQNCTYYIFAFCLLVKHAYTKKVRKWCLLFRLARPMQNSGVINLRTGTETTLLMTFRTNDD